MTSLRDSRILRIIPLLIAAWIFYGGLPVCTQAQVVYEVIDLGTLGIDESGAYSINDAGQIVGSAAVRYGRESLEFHATLFDPTGAGNNIDLGTLGHDQSEASCINNKGQIVGMSGSYGWGAGWHAILFDPTGAGNNIGLGTLGGDTSGAECINDAGQIVGWAEIDVWIGHATIFDPTGAGNNIDLGTLGGIFSAASSINDAGQIVGVAYNTQDNGRATLFDPTGAGNNIDLGTLGGFSSEARYINDAGQIVGVAYNTQNNGRATLFDPTGAGNNTDLGTLGGDWSWTYSINDAGQIVGVADNTQNNGRATLFDPTGAGNNINLNARIDPASGWDLRVANDINNSGWIVGSGINSEGKSHAFLLVPIATKYSGGTGEFNDPYQIATAEDLMLLGESPEDYDKHFILIADIDLDPNLPGRKVFDRAVIAPDVNDDEDWFQGTAFTGLFDGNGHTVSHLTIEGGGNLGLFGELDSGAMISNLGLPAVDINGTGDAVGGLAGVNEGTITTSYSTGSVSGSSVVGGLVGGNVSSITSSYSMGMVSAGNTVGGIVGINLGSITTSYSIGMVSGTLSVGGLVGRGAAPPHSYGIATYCFWDMQTSDQVTSTGGTGKTTAEMKQQSTFTDWDFINVWDIGENQTYPYLRKYSAADINQDESVNFGDLAILAENWLASSTP